MAPVLHAAWRLRPTPSCSLVGPLQLNMSVFKARNFEASRSSTLSTRQSFLDDSADVRSATLTPPGVNFGVELTKNDKFCVSRLPSLPPLLRNTKENIDANIDENENTGGNNGSEFLNGYTDNVTKCALVISEKAINVWPYDSTDETPLTFEFPFEKGQEDHMQLAILTPPAPGALLDPGLAIIDAITGQVKFYESVQHAPALGIMNSRLIETVIQMLVNQGEYVTLAENIEPAGIVIATTWRRVVLISLRDAKGVPSLSTLELTQTPKASKIFSSWLAGPSGHLFSDDIVSIKSGKITNHGTCQEILVQDASGTFKKFFYQSSSTGAPFINHKRGLLYQLSSFLDNSIDALIPGTVYDLKFYDLWPFPLQASPENEDLFIALVGVQSSMTDSDEQNFYLVTMKINDTGVLVLRSHSLPKPSNPLWNYASAKPKLFVPKPGKTAFVVVGNSVILADLSTSPQTSTSSSLVYYEPKWLDVINFNSSLHIIGCGYEDMLNGNNAALVFITSGYGVVRIERFDREVGQNAEEEFDTTDPVFLLVSRIQQAIHYSDSDLVNFDITEAVPSREVVTSSVKGVISSILDSSSPYLPSLFPSTRDSLSVRIKLSKELISYTQRNFDAYRQELIPLIVEALEKLEVSFNLWNFFDTESGTASKHILKEAILKTDFAKHFSSKDLVHSFFSQGVKEILPVWTQVLEGLREAGTPSKTLIELLVKTLHDSVYKAEKSYLEPDSENCRRKLWIEDSNLVVIAEQMYSDFFCTQTNEFILTSPEDRTHLLELTAALYLSVCKVINYQQYTYDDKLESTIKWYHRRKTAWVEALLKRGLSKEALSLAEEYYDFLSVCEILEKEKDPGCVDYVAKMDYYMETYGYDFAAKMFDHCLSKDKPNMILLDLQPYFEYYDEYFQKNPKKSSKISWVYYLLLSDYEEAARILLQSSNSKDFDNEENRELNYSIAKLAAVEANIRQPDSMKLGVFEEYAREAEQNLIAIRVQNRLRQAVSHYMKDHEELITLAYFMDNFSNKALDTEDIEEDIKPFFHDFVDKRLLLKEQLITLLTSIAPKGPFENVYSDALNVAALMKNESQYKSSAAVIWKRLLYIEDWKVITSTSDHTDNVTKTMVKETAMYKTLQTLRNSDVLDTLKELLGSVKNSSETHGKLDERVRELICHYNVDEWIRAILENGV